MSSAPFSQIKCSHTNLSPSFNWDNTGMRGRNAPVPGRARHMGFVFNFITYGGHQIEGRHIGSGEDPLDRHLTISSCKPRTIFHLGGMLSVPSDADHAASFRANAMGTVPHLGGGQTVRGRAGHLQQYACHLRSRPGGGNDCRRLLAPAAATVLRHHESIQRIDGSILSKMDSASISAVFATHRSSGRVSRPPGSCSIRTG